MTQGKKQTYELQATARETFGKQNRSLRKDNKLPGNIYGQNMKPVAVTLDNLEFRNLYKEAGETSVVNLKVGDKSYPTLVSEVQIHPVMETILHVDFRKVNLKKKIEAYVPVEIIGESAAVEDKNGILLTQTEEILVEALPNDIPHQIEIDISTLTEIGDEIKVSDLKTDGTYEIKEDQERTIVLVTEHKEEDVEPDTAVEAPEITTAVDGETPETESSSSESSKGKPSEEPSESSDKNNE